MRNPTHIAVCLGYHPTGICQWPTRPEKRQCDACQLYCANIAERNRIPVVENAELARSLFLKWNAEIKIPENVICKTRCSLVTYGDEDRLCAFYRNTINAFGMLLFRPLRRLRVVIAYRAALTIEMREIENNRF